jgi:hypothetical protein
MVFPQTNMAKLGMTDLRFTNIITSITGMKLKIITTMMRNFSLRQAPLN